MATLNEVDIQLRAQGENEATAALKRFRDESKRLSTSVIDSGRKIESINSRWKEAERLQQKNVISAKALRAAQTQLAREYAVLNGMTETYVRNGQQYTRVATNQAKTTLLNKAATEQAAAAQAQYTQRMEQLRLRLDPVYRASQQYKQSLRELIQFQKAGGITMDEYRQRVVQLKDEFGKVSQGGRGARRSMNNFNIGIQQAGFQISDFAIQVQSGQSAFVAFSQQASQLVGILPLVADNIGLTAGKAIALSSGLGIAIPLITVAAGALFDMGKNSEEAADDVDFLADAVKNASRELKEYREEIALVGSEYETLAEVGLSTQISNTQKELDALLSQREQILQSASTGFSAPGATQDYEEETSEALKENTSEIEKQIYLKKQQLSQLVQERESLETVKRLMRDTNDLVEAGSRAVLERNRNFYQTTLELDRQLRLVQAEIQYGEESLEVVKLRAKQEAILKGYTQDQIDAYVAQVVEIERVKDEAEELNRTLDQTFRNRTVMYSIRFSGEETVMSQPVLQPPKAPDMPSYKDLIAMGWTAKDIEAMGVSRPTGRGGGGGGGGAGSAFSAQDYLAGLEQEAKFKRSLVGLSDEQVKTAERRQTIVEKLTQDGENLTETESKRVEELIKMEAQTRRLTEAEEQRQAMMDRVEGHMKNALMSVVDGSKSVEDAFRTMMRNIILSVYETKVAEPAANAFGNLVEAGISSLFTNAKGNVISGGEHVTAYADGGVVNRATMFPMRGGMGLMGEAGPEAIMPLKRGSNGKLGVQMDGAAGGVTVNQYFNISANGDESVKRIVRQESPRIAEQAKSAVVDAKRRGGTYGRSF